MVKQGAFSEFPEPTVSYEPEGVAKGYSTTKIDVTLTPVSPGVTEVSTLHPTPHTLNPTP